MTVSHGHLAFFGAYVLLNLTFMYFAMPLLRKLPRGVYDERAGQWGFWLMSAGVLGMSLAFGVAGVLQTYLERVQGQPYMMAAQPIRFWMVVAFAHGLIALAGAIVTVVHLLRLRPLHLLRLRLLRLPRQRPLHLLRLRLPYLLRLKPPVVRSRPSESH